MTYPELPEVSYAVGYNKVGILRLLSPYMGEQFASAEEAKRYLDEEDGAEYGYEIFEIRKYVPPANPESDNGSDPGSIHSGDNQSGEGQTPVKVWCNRCQDYVTVTGFDK